MDCGPTCLRMIASFYGISFDPEGMKHMSRISRRGSSMLDLMNAAEKLGLRSAGMELGIAQLEAAVLPAILHWDLQHFVVLFKVKNDIYYIADPAMGILKFCRPAFLSHWQNPGTGDAHRGIILTFSAEP
ncbi:Peptidase C39 family protein [Pedobacter westerhofensis]|uniref:Peptidase C39 family protein n=2 Tax=Pedobacter westerhofensis TaxID=425512 RepID=A0A521AH03_9SPHI|nr:Peptidase C39 family protein [Pedobacter westerhofensis]